MKKLILPLVMLASLWAPSPARAYSYAVKFWGPCWSGADSPVWTAVLELHTVGSVCHNVQGWGIPMDNQNPWKASSASICLVDRLTVRTSSGKSWSWSGMGRTSYTFMVSCDPNDDTWPEGIYACGSGTNAACSVRIE